MSLTRERIVQKFKQFDSSGDGKLTYDEFKSHLEEILKVSVSDMACHNVFDCVNKESDDYITIDEWLGALDKTSIKDIGDNELEGVFAECDSSHDGKIKKCELREVLAKKNCKVTEEELEAMFKDADTNNDGNISLCEFKKAFYKDMED